VNSVRDIEWRTIKKLWFTKKKIDDLELLSDVYVPDHVYPVIVHFHGGGFTTGSRNDEIKDIILDFTQETGFISPLIIDFVLK